MSSNITIDELARYFVAASNSQKCLFLSLYASELSTLMRGYFFDGDNEKAKRCNESLHRILGGIVVLARNRSIEDAASFIEMIASGSKQRGLESVLLRTFEETAGQNLKTSETGL